MLEDDVLVLYVEELNARCVVKHNEEVLGEGELKDKSLVFYGELTVTLLLAVYLM